jgi:hypothetical protein
MISSQNIDRREFIKTCLRFGIGGGLITTGLIISTRDKTGSGSSDICQINSPCQGCSQFSGCSLPKAEDAKKIVKSEGGNYGQ